MSAMTSDSNESNPLIDTVMRQVSEVVMHDCQVIMQTTALPLVTIVDNTRTSIT